MGSSYGRITGIKVSVFMMVLKIISGDDLFSSSDLATGMFIFEKNLLGSMERFVTVSRKRLDAFTK